MGDNSYFCRLFQHKYTICRNVYFKESYLHKDIFRRHTAFGIMEASNKRWLGSLL